MKKEETLISCGVDIDFVSFLILYGPPAWENYRVFFGHGVFHPKLNFEFFLNFKNRRYTLLVSQDPIFMCV